MKDLVRGSDPSDGHLTDIYVSACGGGRWDALVRW